MNLPLAVDNLAEVEEVFLYETVRPSVIRLERFHIGVGWKRGGIGTESRPFGKIPQPLQIHARELLEIAAAVVAKADAGVGEFAGAVEIDAVDVVRAIFPGDLAKGGAVGVSGKTDHTRRVHPAVMRIEAVGLAVGVAHQPIVELRMGFQKFRLQHQRHAIIRIAIEIHTGAAALARDFLNQVAVFQLIVQRERLARVISAISDGLEAQQVSTQFGNDLNQPPGIEILHVGINGRRVSVKIDRLRIVEPFGGLVAVIGEVFR